MTASAGPVRPTHGAADAVAQGAHDRPLGRDRQVLLRVALSAAGVWLATRVAYVVFTYFTVVLNQPESSDARSLIQIWDQFDTHLYLLISRRGYFWVPTAAFFPLYPALVGGISSLLGHAAGPIWPAFDIVRLIVALGVANLGTLSAFVGLSLLAWHEYGEERMASLVVLVVAAYPFAFFLTAAYTEGTFLAAAVFTLYFTRRGSWRWAALAALIAGLTRATALALIMPLGWEYGRQHGWWRRGRYRQIRRSTVVEALAVGAAPAAVAAFAGFLWLHFGTPIIWLTVQSDEWHRHATPVWQTLARLGHRLVAFPAFGSAEANLLLNLVPVVLCMTVVLIAIRQIPVSFFLYVIGLCYLSISAPINGRPELIESAGRFLIAAVPVFLVLARWMQRHPVLGHAWMSAGFLLQAVLLAAFLQGRWVG